MVGASFVGGKWPSFIGHLGYAARQSLASLAANLRLEKKLLEMDMISEMRSWLVEPEDDDDEDEDDDDADDGATAQAATPM